MTNDLDFYVTDSTGLVSLPRFCPDDTTCVIPPRGRIVSPNTNHNQETQR